jgi:hypothetical protein
VVGDALALGEEEGTLMGVGGKLAISCAEGTGTLSISSCKQANCSSFFCVSARRSADASAWDDIFAVINT